MSTHNSSHKRHELMPLGASRKRKDRDVMDAPRAPVTTKHKPAAPPTEQRKQPIQPAGGGNRLLAGYLAHEFLTKGTLFGQRWDPAAAGAKPPAPPKLPVPQQQRQKQKHPPPEPKQGKPPPPEPTAYHEVAYLLKTDGAHIPGVVNPTQLARWLQM